MVLTTAREETASSA